MNKETTAQHDFSIPQKQSASGIIVLFINSLQKTVRAIFIPILLIIFKSKDSGNLATIIITGSILLVVILAILTYIRYQRFSFFLDEEKQEFVINEGIFNKSTLSIQLNKIQQVNINQSLLQQLVGVYSVEIDTAGSEKKEASIKAVDHTTAIELKERLLSKEGLYEETLSDTETGVKIPVTATPFLSLSIPTLLKVGITTNYGASFVLLGGFILGLIQLFKDYTSAFEIEDSQIDQVLNRGFTFFSICVLIVLALLIVLATNIIRTLVKYFNFRISKQKNALAISSGLFTRKNVLLKPNKVQLSAYSQNYFQKKFDLLNIKIKQATYETANEEENKKTDIEIPGCDVTERDEILKMIYQQIPSAGITLLPNYRFVFLQIMRWIVLPALIFLSIGLFFHPPFRQYFTLIIPYVIVASTMIYFEFKRHRLYLNEDFIIKRSGIWDVTHEIIEPHKIQAITAKQYFWHKKADIGHLILHTAAGLIHFKYGNYTTINQMINFWTYKVESTKKGWN
ncbi:PH domain-containing protein [Pedobacter nyackensis]|uniref:PH domain-containing protein n=1 Tax=Pedobacter nyackensis TaxID=475255 RepID=UPI00292E6EEA|nr:PH domain-containing protein [Pedobacter nyackensis]